MSRVECRRRRECRRSACPVAGGLEIAVLIAYRTKVPVWSHRPTVDSVRAGKSQYRSRGDWHTPKIPRLAAGDDAAEDSNLPAPVSAIKWSPFGALRICRGVVRPLETKISDLEAGRSIRNGRSQAACRLGKEPLQSAFTCLAAAEPREG